MFAVLTTRLATDPADEMRVVCVVLLLSVCPTFVALDELPSPAEALRVPTQRFLEGPMLFLAIVSDTVWVTLVVLGLGSATRQVLLAPLQFMILVQTRVLCVRVRLTSLSMSM